MFQVEMYVRRIPAGIAGLRDPDRIAKFEVENLGRVGSRMDSSAVDLCQYADGSQDRVPIHFPAVDQGRRLKCIVG